MFNSIINKIKSLFIKKEDTYEDKLLNIFIKYLFNNRYNNKEKFYIYGNDMVQEYHWDILNKNNLESILKYEIDELLPKDYRFLESIAITEKKIIFQIWYNFWHSAGEKKRYKWKDIIDYEKLELFLANL